MTAFLIVLIGFVLAWSIIGFAFAMLFLRLHWNLVGGFFLLTFGWLPIVTWIGLLIYLQWSGQHWTRWYTLEGIYEVGPEGLNLVSAFGYLLGIMAGTFAGMMPQKSEERPRDRKARSWPLIRTFGVAGLAMVMAWTIFFLADWRARSKLKQWHADITSELKDSTEMISAEANDAAAMHDQLLLDLMQDTSPIWLGNTSGFHAMRQTRPQKFPTQDTTLLRAFTPGSTKIEAVKAFVSRHQKAFNQLRSEVNANADEIHSWHPLIARLTAFEALVRLYEGDLETVLSDLQLLRILGSQLVDPRLDDCPSYQWFEYYRYLVFQAVLGKEFPIADAIYDEMLQPIPGLRASIHRQLTRRFNELAIESIDSILQAPEDDRWTLDEISMAMVVRIIYSTKLPYMVNRVKQQLDRYFRSEDSYTEPYSPVWFSRPWYKFDRGTFYEFDLPEQHLVDFSAIHFMRYDLIRVARRVQGFKQDRGRYPTQDEFIALVPMDEYHDLAATTYVALADPDADAIVGVILFRWSHENLDDQLGLHMGKSFFRLVQILDDLQLIESIGNGVAVWTFDPLAIHPLHPTLPADGDSTLIDRDKPID